MFEGEMIEYRMCGCVSSSLRGSSHVTTLPGLFIYHYLLVDQEKPDSQIILNSFGDLRNEIRYLKRR